MSDQKHDLVELVSATTALILLLAVFIISILHAYQKKQFAFKKRIAEIKLDHEKDLLQTRLEIHEQTLEEVSREIHDNIALGLTLSKLNLNTLNYSATGQIREKVTFSVDLIGEAIQNLSDISKGLTADTIRQHGLLRSIENEIAKVGQTGQYQVFYELEGTPVFLSAEAELAVYRILQESLNNMVKHSRASRIAVTLCYKPDAFEMTIRDNGRGFSFNQIRQSAKPGAGSGLNNMQLRAKTINSECKIVSKIGHGTMVKLIVPLEDNENNNN